MKTQHALNYDRIEDFFQKHRAVKVSVIEKESDVAEGTLAKFLAGKRGLTEKNAESIAKTLKNYGL